MYFHSGLAAFFADFDSSEATFEWILVHVLFCSCGKAKKEYGKFSLFAEEIHLKQMVYSCESLCYVFAFPEHRPTLAKA